MNQYFICVCYFMSGNIHFLFYSILFYLILFYSILLCSILFYSIRRHSVPVAIVVEALVLKKENTLTVYFKQGGVHGEAQVSTFAIILLNIARTGRTDFHVSKGNVICFNITIYEKI